MRVAGLILNFLSTGLQFFLKSIPPTRPVLLVQDGHSSHVSIELIEMARENGVCLLRLPAHTLHILQRRSF